LPRLLTTPLAANQPIIKMVLDYDVRIPFRGIGFSGSRNEEMHGQSRFPLASRGVFRNEAPDKTIGGTVSSDKF
jgi:hypothetical protein